MRDRKLLRLMDGNATELQRDASDLEKPLQTLIEDSGAQLAGRRWRRSARTPDAAD